MIALFFELLGLPGFHAPAWVGWLRFHLQKINIVRGAMKRIRAYLDQCSRKVMLSILFMFFVVSGCESDTTNEYYISPETDHAIVGKVTDGNFAMGNIEVFDDAGNCLSIAKEAIDVKGDFIIYFPSPLPISEYYRIVATKSEKILRAIVTGYNGTYLYSGNDAIISPYTEAAYLACTSTGALRLRDYAAFLGSYKTDAYATSMPDSCQFPYREIIDQIAQEVALYTNGGMNDVPSVEDIYKLIEEKNHVLGAFLRTEPIAGVYGTPLVTRALVLPDRSGHIFLTYDAQTSTLDSNTRINLSTSPTNEDGSFQWKMFSINLGVNTLRSLRVNVVQSEGSSTPLPSVAVSYSPAIGVEAITGNNALISQASGTIAVAVSNVGSLMDPNASGFVAAADNETAVFKVAFSETVASSNSNIVFSLAPLNQESPWDGLEPGTIYETIPLTSGSSFETSSVDLITNRNQMMTAVISNGSDAIYSLWDIIDKTRYLSTGPMIAYRSLTETRVDLSDMYNNYPNSHETNQTMDAGNIYSHYVLDFDRLLGTGTFTAWDNTDYGKSPLMDTQPRIPLILVHGWQGESGFDSSAMLGFWWASPVNYFYNFISYYLMVPALQEAYHLYLVRWPSFKHLTFSGGILSDMLQEVKTNQPGTNLAQGLKSEDTGVVFITHSTGGLITRSAIETHGAVSGGTDIGTYLRGAVLLASPNHGTPEAIDTAPNNWTYLAHKDVATQGSADLEWDSFDGNHKVFFYDSYTTDRKAKRWISTIENVREFDHYYMNKLTDPSSPTYDAALVPGDVPSYNPWLLWFNKVFDDNYKNALKEKYILYSGWTRGLLESGNVIDNSADLDFASWLMRLERYEGDSVLPIASNLFATNGHDTAFNPGKDDYLVQGTFPNSTLYVYEGGAHVPTNPFTIILIGAAADHPLNLRFRYLWDYDHMQTVMGALVTDGKTYLNSDIDKLLEDDSATINWAETGNYLYSDMRDAYITGAIAYQKGISQEEVILPEPLPGNDYLNQLEYEPVFMIIEKDLLDLAK